MLWHSSNISSHDWDCQVHRANINFYQDCKCSQYWLSMESYGILLWFQVLEEQKAIGVVVTPVYLRFWCPQITIVYLRIHRIAWNKWGTKKSISNPRFMMTLYELNEFFNSHIYNFFWTITNRKSPYRIIVGEQEVIHVKIMLDLLYHDGVMAMASSSSLFSC